MPPAPSKPAALKQAAPKQAPKPTIDGSLCDHPPRKLFDICQRQRVTGALHIASWGRSGRIELRAGHITAVAFGLVVGDGAVSEILALRDGTFELRQELPRLPAGPDAHRIGLSAVREQCRERALSCRIRASSRGQRAVVTYRAGALEQVALDGAALDTSGGGDTADTALAPFEHGQMQVEPLLTSLRDLVVPAAAAAPAARPDTSTVTRPAPPARPSAGRPAPPARALPARAPGTAGDARPRAAPPPLPRLPGYPQPDAALATGLRPWLPGPGISGAAASWRDAPASRRELTLPAILAVLALMLVLIIGFLALQP
jgi:hypothetical protein